jgi:hypothetical protein
VAQFTALYASHNLDTSKVIGDGINAMGMTLNDTGVIQAADIIALNDESTTAIDS